MPSYLIPRKSGVHRAACLALARALFRQTRQLPLPPHLQSTVADQIRAIVKRNAPLQSPKEISTALSLGYKTLDALRSPTRWQNILARILELGAQKLSKARNTTRKAALQNPSQDTKPKPSRVWPLPGASKVVERPFPNLSGTRHIPKLVNANRVPFLRLGKPQSPFVSRIIRDTIATRERRIDLSDRLSAQLPLAHQEDLWDRNLRENCGFEEKGNGGWAIEVQSALGENGKFQAAAVQKRIDVAAKMHEIVKKEKRLALEEKSKIQDEKGMKMETAHPAGNESPFFIEKQGSALDHANIPSDPQPTIHPPSNLIPKQEPNLTPASNKPLRTEAEIEAIKAARKERKEAKALKKAEKIKRKEQNARESESKKLASQKQEIGIGARDEQGNVVSAMDDRVLGLKDEDGDTDTDGGEVDFERGTTEDGRQDVCAEAI